MSVYEEIKADLEERLEGVVEVTPGLKIKDYLDSLEIFDAVYQAEIKYKFNMPNDEVEKINTVQDFVNLIERLK